MYYMYCTYLTYILYFCMDLYMHWGDLYVYRPSLYSLTESIDLILQNLK